MSAPSLAASARFTLILPTASRDFQVLAFKGEEQTCEARREQANRA